MGKWLSRSNQDEEKVGFDITESHEFGRVLKFVETSGIVPLAKGPLRIQAEEMKGMDTTGLNWQVSLPRRLVEFFLDVCETLTSLW